MDAELYSRVRKLEKQVEALLERHPEVRAVLGREVQMFQASGSTDADDSASKIAEMFWRSLEAAKRDGCGVPSAITHDPPCETCGTLSKPRRARDLLYGRHYLCSSCAATAYEV